MRTSFREHPTQRVEGPNGAAYLVEVKPVATPPAASTSGSRHAGVLQDSRALSTAWAVEVSVPGVDGFGPVLLEETYGSKARTTRRARAIQRRLRRGMLPRRATRS